MASLSLMRHTPQWLQNSLKSPILSTAPRNSESSPILTLIWGGAVWPIQLAPEPHDSTSIASVFLKTSLFLLKKSREIRLSQGTSSTVDPVTSFPFSRSSRAISLTCSSPPVAQMVAQSEQPIMNTLENFSTADNTSARLFFVV
jgi:hypothetical protein